MDDDTRCTVLVVDDHTIVRSGLRMLIEAQRDLQVVGEAPSGEGAIRILDELSAQEALPQVVLMDLMMEGIGGVEATRRIKLDWPDVAVLVLTMADDRAYIREAFRVGASGYVLKDAADVELVHAIRAVADGGRYLHPTLGAELLRAEEEARRGPKTSRGVPLSGREVDVLRLVALGYSNREVAEELVISIRTVETHKTHIMQKTGLKTRAQLVKFAIEAGLLPQR